MAVGQQTSVFEFGWGTGTWNTARDNSQGWDVPASGSGIEVDARTWSFDNFGEDLVASVAGQPLIHWDASAGVGTRAVFIHDCLGTAISTHTSSTRPRPGCSLLNYSQGRRAGNPEHPQGAGSWSHRRSSIHREAYSTCNPATSLTTDQSRYEYSA